MSKNGDCHNRAISVFVNSLRYRCNNFALKITDNEKIDSIRFI